VLDSTSASKDNEKNTKKVVRSNKRKAAAVSADDDVCKEVAGNIKRVRRKDGRGYRLLCSSAGCNNQVIKGGVCVRHGAKKKTCSHKGCNNQAKKRGVCIRHGANVKS